MTAQPDLTDAERALLSRGQWGAPSADPQSVELARRGLAEKRVDNGRVAQWRSTSAGELAAGGAAETPRDGITPVQAELLRAEGWRRAPRGWLPPKGTALFICARRRAGDDAVRLTGGDAWALREFSRELRTVRGGLTPQDRPAIEVLAAKGILFSQIARLYGVAADDVAALINGAGE